ncbi:hypothetical protein [Clavibacter phaseoli]|uniref:hypothetical protein n=1 Tax=Clavibacter phaseoli TaxID=1734031 RepID=UPI000E660018|nr:hypothetical protein [Clavibacter phaseoli]RIJ56358.1 hypothetical protein DZF99_06490 [Clavibacter phaseoli]UKF29951.1 hypothetical protein FGD69_02290 [Clavibacter phaseoli]UKF35869.1 hypothetical protein FGI33_01670 [Clavibacter phaseoli]
MSTADAPPDRTAVPVGRLVTVLVVLGLAGVVTAGGSVMLAARIRASSTGFEVDGLSLLLPGLGVTAVVTFLAAATTARIARGARRIQADALGRHAAALAPVPLGVTAALVLLLCEHGDLAEVVARRPGLAILPVALFGTAAVAQVVAARARGRVMRIRALGVAGAALVGAACAMPYLMSAAVQSGALVLCAALLLRSTRGAGSAQLSGRVPSGSTPPA